MQWLVAGSGALHEEILNGDPDGWFHMAQLWINVPADLKMADPEHHALGAEAVPDITSLGHGSLLRLYAGELAGRRGPAPLPTPVLIGHIRLDADGRITIPVPSGWTAAACVVAGKAVASVDEAPLPTGATPVFDDDGESVGFSSVSGAELLLMAGEPIGEPIAMGGGFVMNTGQEITEAFDDYRNGLMGALAASR